MRKQIGWDIGGAHLKAAFLNEHGEIEHLQQSPCALWLGLEQLEGAITKTLKGFGVESDQCDHAVTMTGELVDLFLNRHEGVVEISQLAKTLLGESTLFYSMSQTAKDGNFLGFDQVLNLSSMVASANWHASASLLAKQVPNALLIDIGSTTTDIITIDCGMVADSALTDARRMQLDSLVYTGVVRTPLMAVAQKLMLDGKETNVAAEHFATMADVYRLTAELPPEADMVDTADGQAKTLLASAQRLARMVGHDVEDKPMGCWLQLASECREKQLEQIQLAVMKHIKGEMKIVGAGAGVFLVEKIARTLDQPYVELASLFKSEARSDLAVCLPAYAVAKLALFRGGV